MKKLIPFFAIVSIILLLLAGLSACGEAGTWGQKPVEQGAPASDTTTPTESETPTSTPPSGEVQVVLAELFTGDWWHYCPFAARAIEQLAGELGPEKLLVLQYHSGDKYATPETEAKAAEYKVRRFPTIFFNGGNSVVGGGSSNYDQYRDVVNRELANQSSVRIAGVMTSSGGTLSLDVTITKISDSPITGVKLMAVVYEDIGIEEHHYVVRDILPASEIASLSGGETQEFSLNSDFLDGLPRLRAVLFLQSSSGKILQSAIATAQ